MIKGKISRVTVEADRLQENAISVLKERKGVLKNIAQVGRQGNAIYWETPCPHGCGRHLFRVRVLPGRAERRWAIEADGILGRKLQIHERFCKALIQDALRAQLFFEEAKARMEKSKASENWETVTVLELVPGDTILRFGERVTVVSVRLYSQPPVSPGRWNVIQYKWEGGGSERTWNVTPVQAISRLKVAPKIAEPVESVMEKTNGYMVKVIEVKVGDVVWWDGRWLEVRSMMAYPRENKQTLFLYEEGKKGSASRYVASLMQDDQIMRRADQASQTVTDHGTKLDSALDYIRKTIQKKCGCGPSSNMHEDYCPEDTDVPFGRLVAALRDVFNVIDPEILRNPQVTVDLSKIDPARIKKAVEEKGKKTQKIVLSSTQQTGSKIKKDALDLAKELCWIVEQLKSGDAMGLQYAKETANQFRKANALEEAEGD